MGEALCTYPGNREEALIAYLYEDMAPSARTVFESHVANCSTCRRELAGLGGVRARLAEWVPPERTDRRAPIGALAVSRRPRFLAAMHELPMWMQVAAALLFVGVSAGAANLDIEHSAEGFSIHTGWSRTAASVPVPARQEPVLTAVSEPLASKADLAVIEHQLRDEIAEARAATPALARQVRALVADSERKQENELALRMATLSRDLSAQRQADFARMDRNLGLLSSATGQEVRRQTEMYRTLLTRFQQRQ